MPETATEESSLRAQVLARRGEEAAALAKLSPAPEDQPLELDPDFIDSCLNENERGDGVIFATLMRDRFVYVTKQDVWLTWRGHHWAEDESEEVISAVEEVALVYLKTSESLNEPISREKEQLHETSAKAKAAAERLKELQKLSDPGSARIEEARSEELQARSASDRHLANYKALQKKKKRLCDRVDRLRCKPGAEKCAWWSWHLKEGALKIHVDVLDKKPLLLPAPNGVINLVTGQLQPGRPSDYLVRAIPIPYPEHLGWERIRRYLETGEDFFFPPWQNFIDNLVAPLPDGTPDREVIGCLHKLLGNSITGDTTLQKVCIVLGDGRNGKGVMFHTIEDILGDFAWTIKSELLLDQKNPQSTAGPSPQLIALKNRRLVVASETNKHRYIGEAQVKEFSGGDKVNARDMYSGKEENIRPTHHLWLQTNHLPSGLFKSFSLKKRLVVFDFPYMYVDDPELEARKEPHNAHRFRLKDESLEETLKEGKEYILIWLILGAILAQRDGVTVPAKLRADMEGIQFMEDNLEQFLSGCVRDYDPDRAYEDGDVVNLPHSEEPSRGLGELYLLRLPSDCEGTTVRGEHPRDSGKWVYQGAGLNPGQITLFKDFYGTFKKWYAENITEKEKDLPSAKSVAENMRKKGYDVRSKGGQTKIFGEIRQIPS